MTKALQTRKNRISHDMEGNGNNEETVDKQWAS